MKTKEEFLKQFEHKDINFVVDEFREIHLRDVYQYDEATLKKLHTNITSIFINWIKQKQNKKENISINIKGDTRGGKSLTGLSVIDTIELKYEDKNFNIPFLVCGNQKEFRQKLKEAVFGDSFLIDENAFSNVGIGSHTEMLQLRDIQNIIAKENIGTIYITPREFLETNATLGLEVHGKDAKNWLTKLLVYDLRTKAYPLMGFIIVDVGKLFRKHGCYLYKKIGGCTNPTNTKFKDIEKEYIKYSSCIPKDFNKNDLQKDSKRCPFYDICKHPLNQYEKKKDTWISKEMKGGLDERVQERYETAIKLFILNFEYSQSENKFVQTFKDGKQLKIKVNLQIGEVTNTKYTITELDEICVMIKALQDMKFFKSTCEKLNLNFEEEFNKIDKI